MLTASQVHFASLRKGTGGIRLRGYFSIILYQLFVVCTAGIFCILFLVGYKDLGGHPAKLETELLDYITGRTDVKPDPRFGLLYGCASPHLYALTQCTGRSS